MDAYEALVTRVSPKELGEPRPMMRRCIRSSPPHCARPITAACGLGASLRSAGRPASGWAKCLCRAFCGATPASHPEEIERERQKPLRAPLVLVVAAHLVDERQNPRCRAASLGGSGGAKHPACLSCAGL